MDKQRVIEIVVAAGGIRNEHNYIKPHIMICEDKLPEIAAQILVEAAKPAQIFGGQAMNTGQINADYHLYKRQLDEANKRIKELEQALRDRSSERDTAIGMLADWCVAVELNGASWDDWDEHYKTASYRPCAIRELLDIAIYERKPMERKQ